MQITITSVTNSPAPGGKKYNILDVAFVNERGENKTWKQFSFTGPAVFAALKEAKPGDVYDITTAKNDKDFTIWASATKSTGAPKASPNAPAGTAYKPTYETAEERAIKQRLIVRQSSLGYAITALTTGSKSPPDTQAVIDLADKFVAYVYDAPELNVELETMPDDLPY